MKCQGRDFLNFLMQSYIGRYRAIQVRIKKQRKDTTVYQCVIRFNNQAKVVLIVRVSLICYFE